MIDLTYNPKPHDDDTIQCMVMDVHDTRADAAGLIRELPSNNEHNTIVARILRGALISKSC